MFYVWLIVAVILYFFLKKHPLTRSSPLAHALLWPLFLVLIILNYITSKMAEKSFLLAENNENELEGYYREIGVNKEDELEGYCKELGINKAEYLRITTNDMPRVRILAQNLESIDPRLQGLNLDRNTRLATAIFYISKEDSDWKQALWDWDKVNNLSIFPANEHDLENIEHLSFSSISYFDQEKITKIPPEIGKLSRLKTLSLGSVSCPEIYITSLLELPDEVCELSKLQSIHAQFNDLTFLPENIGHLINLKDLKLGGNRLRRLPDSISHLKQLEILTVWQNELHKLPSNIGLLTQLKGLDISSNYLSELPASIVKLTNLEAFYYDAEGLLLSDEQEAWLQYLADSGCEIYS